MSIKAQAHILAMKELIELITMAACLALISDTLWLIRDITVNGFTWGLFCIGAGLLAATSITMIGLWNYHKSHVRSILKERLQEKLKIRKIKEKHNRSI